MAQRDRTERLRRGIVGYLNGPCGRPLVAALVAATLLLGGALGTMVKLGVSELLAASARQGREWAALREEFAGVKVTIAGTAVRTDRLEGRVAEHGERLARIEGKRAADRAELP